MAIIGSREQLCIHPEVSKKDTNFEKVSVLPPEIFGLTNTHHTYIHTYTTKIDMKLAGAC